MVRGVDLCQWVAYQRPLHTASTDQGHSENQPESPLPAIEPHPLTSRPPVLCLGLGFTLPSASPSALLRALPAHPPSAGQRPPWPSTQPCSSMPYGGRGRCSSSVRQKEDARPGPPWASSQAAPPPRRDEEAETSLMPRVPASDFSRGH